jgi:hypothetical protein
MNFFAIVDFEQKGFEKYRINQIEALTQLEIPFGSFEKRMTMEKIRKYYQTACILFLEFPEAFGVPIAECLACGTIIFTPSATWPMSWRLNDTEPVQLPSCFVVYNDLEDLKNKLKDYKENFDPEISPKKVFDNFILHYPDLYYGNQSSVEEFTQIIAEHKF